MSNTAKSTQVDPRADPRSNVFLAAKLSIASKSFAVRVRNVSPRGALIEGRDLPPEGAVVQLQRGVLATGGEIAWQSGNERGLRFIAAVDPAEWTRRVGHPGQERVDALVGALRSSAPTLRSPRDLPPSRAERPDFSSIAGSIEEICERLTSLPGLTTELGEELLRLDSIARSLRGWGK